jgi:hypothetical protein
MQQVAVNGVRRFQLGREDLWLVAPSIVGFGCPSLTKRSIAQCPPMTGLVNPATSFISRLLFRFSELE